MLVTAIEARPVRSGASPATCGSRGPARTGRSRPGRQPESGPNGAGKTNFVEALYFGLTGRSFRTSDRRDLIPFGASLARAEVVVRDEDGIEHRLLASVSRTEGRRHLLDGSPRTRRPWPATARPWRSSRPTAWPWSRARRPSAAPTSTASSPRAGRLAPSCASATARRWPSATRCSRGWPPARAAGGLDVWDATLAEAAEPLIAARAEAVEELAGPFAATAAELGLAADATLEYAPRASGSAAEIREGLGQRREQDLRMGRSSWGPHLDELKTATAGRSLRRYGSQGQQRAAPAPCSSPSATRCSRRAGWRRCCCSTT